MENNVADDVDLFVEVWEIFEKYVDENSSDYDELYNIARAIYACDSEFWMKYAHRPMTPEKAAALSKIEDKQRGILLYVITGPRPPIDKIKSALSMIVEIKALLDKGILVGYYSEAQAVALLGGLLTAFDQALDIDWMEKGVFLITPPAVKLYQELRKPYDAMFPQRTICLKKQAAPQKEQDPEKLTGKEKAGLVLFGLASIPAGIVGFIIFMIPWIIVLLIWMLLIR